MKQKIAALIFLLVFTSYILLLACNIKINDKHENAFLKSQEKSEFVFKPQELPAEGLVSGNVSFLSSSQNQVETIIRTARSLIGSTAYNGYCQRFVRVCYESAGIYAKQSAMTALEAWGMWKVSTRMDNIPIGAIVYFQGYGYDWNYGHSAIYIGNGYVIDATNYGVSERKIQNWQGFLGWGYQAGIAPAGSQAVPTPPTLPSRLMGDCDNDSKITAGDARLCLLASTKMITVSNNDFAYYDVNKDGQITALDARLILKCSARLISLN